MKSLKYLVLVALAVATLGACKNGNTNQNAVNKKDRNVSTQILNNYQKNQPAPVRPWSQLRQNLIEIETAQADTTQTTTFFFNLGSPAPIQSCPSIGFSIASTSEITNPEQIVGENGVNAIPQIDPNGIYAGQSTGTYVICIDAQGRAYADYWEGFVQTVTGPAKWNTQTNSVELIGPPSFAFTKSKHP